jgi:hypothetical protein
MVYRVYLNRVGLKLTTLVVVGTNYTGSCKSNYHTITITTTPWHLYILSGSKYKFYTDKSELDFIYIMKKTIYN